MSCSNAPWTYSQVASLNGYQGSDNVHPFTGKRKPNGEETILIATPDGWVEELDGPIVQTWAHPFMADWSWKQKAAAFDAATSIADEDTDPG